MSSLTTESVEGASLPLESIDNVHGRHGPSLGVFCVGDCVTDHVLQKHLENSTGLLVNEARDTLDSTTASETTDSGLSDALDVVTKDLPMTLGTSLSEALSSFATTRHDASFEERLTQVASNSKKLMKTFKGDPPFVGKFARQKCKFHPTSS